VRCLKPVADVVTALRDNGMLTVSAGDNVVRLVPPLTVSEAEIDEAMVRLDKALSAVVPSGAPAH
jgi:acetylornithine/N-succinyldiaminopimelate aminotransferase